MKAKIIFILLCILPIFAMAQDKENEAYLFNKFEKGVALYKGGNQIQSFFNYDLISGKIVFKDGNTVMELANPELFDQISVGDRVFKYIKGETFYEKVDINNLDLYIEWKSQLISQGKNVGYGSSQSSAVNDVSHLSQNGSTYNLNSSEKFNLIPKNSYYVQLKGKYKRFNSAKSLAKLFKNHEDEILKYIDSEKIKFDSEEDIKKAVVFCSQFSD